jgi:hypothetical protein
MDVANTLIYPEEEMSLKKNLESLFHDWYNEAKSKHFIKDYTADDIVFDGFYPFYTFQNKKVLFIGREALGISGENYLSVIHDAYKENFIGNMHINQYKFHNRMFYLAYGINHGFPEWSEIPYASELTGSFATKNGLSFAFMNLSKLSNESSSWNTDEELVDSFINSFSESKTNYFNKEIEILDPDIILSMNLQGRLRSLGQIDVIEYGDEASSYYLYTQNSKKLLLDLFHFAAPSKPDSSFYDPVVRICKKMGIC